MNDPKFDFEKHLEAIKKILSRNQVGSRASMQLIGLLINVAEAQLLLQYELEGHSGSRRFMLRALDTITELVGKLGENLDYREFKALVAHTSEIHLWASGSLGGKKE